MLPITIKVVAGKLQHTKKNEPVKNPVPESPSVVQESGYTGQPDTSPELPSFLCCEYLPSVLKKIEECLPKQLTTIFQDLRDLDQESTNLKKALQTEEENFISGMAQSITEASNLDTLAQLLVSLEEGGEKIRNQRAVIAEKVKQQRQLAQKAYDVLDVQVQEIDQNKRLLESDLESTSAAEMARLRAKQATEPTASEANSRGKPSNIGKSGDTLQNGAGKDNQNCGLETRRTGRKRKKTDEKMDKKTELALQRIFCKDEEITQTIGTHVDPNEPIYCWCQQAAFGEMVGCDNEDCEFEWFHYGCVGLKDPPEGDWYCRDCSSERFKKKKKSKNAC